MITYCLQRYDFFLIPPKNALQKCVSNFCNRNHCNHLWDILFLGFEYFNVDYFSDLSILTTFAPVIQRVTIMTEYIHRNIDSELIAWKEDSMRKLTRKA